MQLYHFQFPDKNKIIKCNMWTRSCTTATPARPKCKFILLIQVHNSIWKYNVSPAHRTYPFCPVGDYQSNGQTYYSTTAATGNYTTTTAGSTGNAHSTTLPYLVPVDDSLLLNGSSQSHSRDSPHSLTVSEVKMKMKLKNPKTKTIEPLCDID